MKLITFIKNNHPSLGVKTEQGVVDLATALMAFPKAHVPSNVMEVIEQGATAIANIRNYIDEVIALQIPSTILDENKLTFGPCVTKPSKIICVGLNYRKHADETNSPYPEVPILFSKFSNTLTGHRQDIAVPNATKKLDYEAELVIVMGKKTKNVSKENALERVFGYCAVNDLSARDLQMKTSQWLLGKSCDDFSPLGPYLVTADEVGNPNQLSMKLIVNGEVRQNSNTSDMIFACDEIVSFVSRHMTLFPGDIILTGTPEGVVLGYPEDMQVYLKPGDEVTIEIENLGSLSNRFVKEM
ncbi:MAG: fumarylacetoacetate hydrolase family protein [Bacilli bacterium]